MGRRHGKRDVIRQGSRRSHAQQARIQHQNRNQVEADIADTHGQDGDKAQLRRAVKAHEAHDQLQQDDGKRTQAQTGDEGLRTLEQARVVGT